MSGCQMFGPPFQDVAGLAFLARLDWLSLEPIPETFEVFRHLLGCLPAHDQWDEDLADAVAVEVDVDSDRLRARSSGWTSTSTRARMGPSMPRTAQLVGG